MSRAIPGFAGLLVGVFTLPFTAGCGSEPVKYDETTIKAADQFRRVAVAYNQAAGRKRKVASADDLKPFLKEHGDPDALLVSPLDGKPIVVVPGITPGAEPGDDEQMIVAYEREGVNGKRMTVDIRGTVVIVSNDDFAKIKFAGGHVPAGR
ncbi:MAG TPA: hypothetical protein VKD90_22370 [Gemmataceae bacterium]|nr:hypothetical protein [Gemmataceae bacterium]